MARVTVEDCLNNVENRFELVLIASERAKKLKDNPKISQIDSNEDSLDVIALREIAGGKVTNAIFNENIAKDEVDLVPSVQFDNK